MAGKKDSGRAVAPAASDEPTKVELQRRMKDAREDISQAVEGIKETVTERYESVKENIVETLDWREQFRKNSVAWSLGAVALGYVVGSSLASSLQGTPKRKGRKSSGLFDEVYAFGERLSEEFSGVAQTILLPALTRKIRDAVGIDLSDRLLSSKTQRRGSGTPKQPAKKVPAKKSSLKPSRKSAVKKSGARKSVKKRGSK